MKNKYALSLCFVLFSFLFTPHAFASATVTSATGGENISASTASSGGTGIFTTLSGPILVEGVKGDIKSGTITLNAPSGFEFDASSPATVTVTSNAGNPATNINHLASGSVITTTTTSLQISFIITSQSTSARNTLTWGNIKVRPTVSSPIATGNITLSSTNSVIGVTLPANVGALAEIAVPVTLSSIAITTPANKVTYIVGETLDISAMVVTGTYSDSSTQSESITTSNISGFDSSVPVTNQVLTVTFNGKTTTYAVNIIAPLSSDKSITSFDISNGTTVISGNNIAINFPSGTSITNLTPTIVTTGVSISPASGLSQDFTNPVIYTVTAADSSTQNYTVTVSVDPAPTPVTPIVIDPPTTNPIAGSYNSIQNVALNTTGSFNIYYTVDNTTPTCATATLYSNTNPVSVSETIQAIACDTNNNSSDVASFAYTITIPSDVTIIKSNGHPTFPEPVVVPVIISPTIVTPPTSSSPIIITSQSVPSHINAKPIIHINTPVVVAVAKTTPKTSVSIAPSITAGSLSASAIGASDPLNSMISLVSHSVTSAISNIMHNFFNLF